MRRLPSAIVIYIIAISCCIFTSASFSQTDTLTIATYNILNYPGTDAATRNPFFRRVIHTMKPDVLVVQEMLSQTGVTTFLNEVMNKYQVGLYSTVPFNDGPDTDNSFYYKSDKITYIGAQYINTALRRIAEYTFQHNNSGEVIKIYSLHLKASATTNDENKRLAEVTILRNHMNALPANTNFIVGGDFNIYKSTEPAYQKLIGSEADNDGRCYDPKTLTGTWNQSGYAIHHTQSPRVRAFGGGSNGGMDDRFDMLLNSWSLTDNLISASYKAYGNDGNHYNDSINRLPNTAVPDSVAHGLHYAADHIPVVAKYVFQSLSAFNLLTPTNNSIDQSISGLLTWQASTGATGYDVYLGTVNPPTTIVSINQTGTSYPYSGTTYNTTYYWKVVAKNSTNTLEATGSPWNFKTIALPAPGSFNLSLPTDGAINQPRSGNLTWSSSSLAAGYDVYLDTLNNPLTIVSSNQTATSFEYQNLISGRTYYWKVIAKNATGTTVGTGSSRSFTIANVPLAPSNFHVIDKSENRIYLGWVDNANDELGYRVYRHNGLAKSNVSGDLPPNTTSFTDTFLLPNTQYIYEVLAYNLQGEGNYASVTSYTLAEVPDIKDKFTYGTTSIYVVIDTKSNPSVTEFAIKVTSDSLIDAYVQNDGTLGIDPVWKTYPVWNGNAGVQVVGLNVATEYFIMTLARNEESNISSMVNFKYITTGSFLVSRNVNQGWNLLSVPVERTDLRKIVVFPFAISSAFAYQGGYSISDTLEYGKGYWLKFNSSIPIEVGGTEKYSDTIRVVAGWNLIGSISSPVAVANIVQDPPGVAASGYWGYDNGYTSAENIEPMKAYWVKANGSGKIILNSVAKSNSKNATAASHISANKLKFSDKTGKQQVLFFGDEVIFPLEKFELPPIPPSDAFDIRFETGRTAALINDHKKHRILLQTSTLPLYLEWEITDNLIYRITDRQGNFDYELKGTGNISLNNELIKSISLERLAGTAQSENILNYALMQNYPNPFNPLTIVNYQLPIDNYVTLKVYDILGKEVAIVVDKFQETGSYSVEFDAKNLSGGMYYYKLQAGTYSEIRKMILLK
ncbi:MAG: fibronectin type III domain-containing protein [Bacteroidota bacterium]|nr:fibronectin type III domain-containing protein [Bacteroidota bacterium]